ncbi:YhbY family RNA-binding protein [Candidatus Bathyarchaeota archaeon]|nr:YhbY family RNA-binding protein [Candidatus Bathyarchaeota archaeon]
MERRIKRELSTQRPTVWVGKNGVTEQVIAEISRQLEKSNMVKIRILRSALEDRETQSVASNIAQQTEANLIDVRGHTLILHKPREG